MVLGVTTKDQNGKVLVYNEYSSFIRGVSGVGGAKPLKRKEGSGSFKSANPKELNARKPDAQKEMKTDVDQAALYRLSGDYNPLHIDPAMSSMGGFDTPILHGLCTFGIAARHVVETFCGQDTGLFKRIKVI